MNREQITIQIVISIIAIVAAAAIVWATSKMFNVFSGLFVPEGAVVAFAMESCPGGWTEYKSAEGRFLKGISENKEIGQLGGQDSVTLIPDNMPRHRHDVHGTDHTLTPSSVDSSEGEYGRYIEGAAETAFEGREQPEPITLVPAYVAVRFCER